jgi:Protein of unknown function (DUF2442)
VFVLRIRQAIAEEGFRLRLTLTDGSVVERDLSDLLTGPVFDAVRKDSAVFRQVTVESGTVTWPNGADLDPDVLIWGGLPPITPTTPPASLTLKNPSLVR